MHVRASSVHVCAWCDAWCVPSVCLGGAWHGIVRHKLGKVCKTHTQWLKHGTQVQSRVFPKIGTHLSPNQYKNVNWTFWQTLGMQHCTTWMGNAWTHRKMPQYKCKMPQGANTDTQIWNRIQPNQNFEKILLKNHEPNPFFENPQF